MEPDSQVLDALIDSPLAEDLGPADLRTLARAMSLENFPQDSFLYREEGPGDCLDYILKGRVAIKKQTEGAGELLLATLGPGRLIGELEILDASPRAASVIALETTRVLRLERAAFLQLTEIAPKVTNGLLQAMVRILADHLRQADAMLAHYGHS